MTMNDIKKLLTKDKLWEAAVAAMENSTLLVRQGYSSALNGDDAHRISLHINDDGTSFITVHDTLFNGTPAPPAAE